MSTLSLTAILGTGMKTSIALTTDHLVTVVLLGQKPKRWLNDTTTESKYQMKSRLLLDIVVTQGTAILKLFTSKNQTLLVWRNSFLILNLGLDIFNCITGLDLKSDGLTGKGLDKNLHFDEFLC